MNCSAALVASAIESEASSDIGLDLVLHVGDISYGDGRPAVWKAFLASVEPVARSVPYHVAVGNHDYDHNSHKAGSEEEEEEEEEEEAGDIASEDDDDDDDDDEEEEVVRRVANPSKDPSGSTTPFNPGWGNYGDESRGECGVVVAAHFPMPGSITTTTSSSLSSSLASLSTISSSSWMGLWSTLVRFPWPKPWAPSTSPRANPPFWYSVSVGPVHITTVSTEHNLAAGSTQHEWLAADLAKVDRSVTPWVVLIAHRPLYVVFPHKSNRKVAKHLRRAVEDMLVERSVDLVLSGHVHSYSRTCPVYKNKCVGRESGGVMYVTAGTGGRKLSDVTTHGQFDWLEFAKPVWGYARVEIDGARSMSIGFVDAKTGKVLDSVVLEGRGRDVGGAGRWRRRSRL
jgi:acid phosphatase type 7